MEASQLRQKKTYDLKLRQKTYQLGDVVYVVDSSGKIGRSKKLLSPWKGPYIIVEVLSHILYKVKGRKTESVLHHDRLKMCNDRTWPVWLKRLRHTILPESSRDAQTKDSQVPQRHAKQKTPLVVKKREQTEDTNQNETLLYNGSEDETGQAEGKRRRRLPRKYDDYILE